MCTLQNRFGNIASFITPMPPTRSQHPSIQITSHEDVLILLLGMYLPKGSKCLYICIFSSFSRPVVCQINNSPRITVSGDESHIMSECYETTLVSCRVSWTVECAVAPILICDSANLTYVCVGEEASLASSFLRGVGR